MPKDDDINRLFDEAKHELKAVVRPKQPTASDGVLSPAAGSAPMPDTPRAVPRPRAKSALPSAPEPDADPEPVVLEQHEPSYEDTFARREAATKPARRRQAELVFPSVAPIPEMTPSIMASVARAPLGRLLVVIAASGAAVTGVVAATGAAVVNVIVALRPPSNAAVAEELEAIKTRVNGDFGMKLETRTRQEKDAELLKEIEAVKRAQTELEARVVVKVEPGRGTR